MPSLEALVIAPAAAANRLSLPLSTRSPLFIVPFRQHRVNLSKGASPMSPVVWFGRKPIPAAGSLLIEITDSILYAHL